MEFVEEIENRRCTNFKITKIPVWALKEFKKFCEEECGNVYAVGIIQLLKIKKEHEILLEYMKNVHGSIKKELKTFGENVKTI